jgi:hypothetical protein
MTLLHTLRNTPWLARLALFWFAMTLGVAVASPMVSLQEEVMICSAAGMYKLVLHDDGSVSTSPGSGMHCPLCVVGGAPPAYVQAVMDTAAPLGRVLQSIPAAPIAALTAAPPPSRAPPAFS